MRRIIGALRLMLPVLMLAAGAGYAGKIYWGYAKGRQEYRDLQQEYTSIYADDEEYDPVVVPQDKEENEETMADKTVWKPLFTPIPDDATSRIRVDWQELSEKNNDLAAWILIPSVDISYPVLQGEDNEYYLHRDINQEYLFAGSIFMDSYNNASFYNYNTIIYGHNMRDGSMFARLKEFSNEATLRQCPYFWILTPDADYLYKICSIHQASSGSDTFTVRFADYEEYKLWQDKMLSLSAPATGETLEYQDRVVTLSTCTEYSTVRMTVQGKLVWKTS